MSNRDCNGDFYEVDGQRWYRCLWDSTVVPAANCADGSCSHCKRKISADDRGAVEKRHILFTEVFYDGRWFAHSTADYPVVTLKQALETALSNTDTMFQNRVRAKEFIVASNWSYLFVDDVRIVRQALGKSIEMTEVADWDAVCEIERAKPAESSGTSKPNEEI